MATDCAENRAFVMARPDGLRNRARGTKRLSRGFTEVIEG